MSFLYNRIFGAAEPSPAAAAETPGDDTTADGAASPPEGSDTPASVGGAGPTAQASSWKASAGRTEGPDGYVFGDFTRGVIVKVTGGKDAPSKEEVEAEAEGDERFSRVQRLARDAVVVYRARGYEGNVSMSHTIGHYTETVSIKVAAVEKPPWEAEDAEAGAEDTDANLTIGDDSWVSRYSAGRVFTTLLARLNRRARAWQDLGAAEDLDPTLGASASIGFAVPVIRVGWGVSVHLTVTQSSLLRWAKHEEEMEAMKAKLVEQQASAAESQATRLAMSPAEEAAVAVAA